jgi:CheY-like chemotaxis protein
MAKVLVIDDDQDIARTTAMILQGGGHTVEVEHDEKKAVERVRSVKPDCIVLDVMFPGNTTAGFELSREIRQNFAQTPVIMITGVNQHGKEKFSNKDIDSNWLPVNEFIEKPVRKERLLELVKKLTAGR